MHSRELLTIEEFLALSAKINYQLSSRVLNKPALLALVLGPAELGERERTVLLQALEVLQIGYQQDRRRVGTPGILHPLRATAILARAMPEPTLLHLLTALLHDKDEDLIEPTLGADRWRALDEAYQRLLGLLDDAERPALVDRVDALSNLRAPSYQDYLTALIDRSSSLHDLLHVKLADRIDNTFDINLQHPGVTGFNFFRAVFDILFVPGFAGVDMGRFHFMPEADEGVMLLSQLFKDILFLALARRAGCDSRDRTSRRLFTGLAVAGIREAQWLLLEMFNTCLADVERQRELLLSVMAYCRGGGAGAVTATGTGNDLDGLLLQFDAASRAGRAKEMLLRLFQDRERLSKALLAFIVVFASFVQNPRYTLAGVEPRGLTASTVPA